MDGLKVQETRRLIHRQIHNEDERQSEGADPIVLPTSNPESWFAHRDAVLFLVKHFGDCRTSEGTFVMCRGCHTQFAQGEESLDAFLSLLLDHLAGGEAGEATPCPATIVGL